MSVPYNPQIMARRSDADLSSAAWKCAIANGDDDTDVSGAGGDVIGVFTDDVKDGSSTAAFNAMQYAGIGKVSFGGAVTAGASIKSDASGEAVVGTTGDVCFGYALETHADGDIGAFVFSRHTAP